jgi:signal transduction histidine kinase
MPTRNQLRQYRKDHPALLENSPYVVVDFTDNGTGMSPATADQVFEPFFTTKTSGAGLGLSIVYRTLKENDAAIVLKSKEGKGTTFTIFLKADV